MEELEELKKKYSNIYVFGAGMYGHMFADFLRRVRLSRYVDGFLVSKKGDNPECIRGVPVITIDDVIEKSTALVIMAVHAEKKKEIGVLLKQNGYEHILHISSVMDPRDLYICKQRYNMKHYGFDALQCKIKDDLIKKYGAERKKGNHDGIYKTRLEELKESYCHIRMVQMSILNIGPLANYYAILQMWKEKGGIEEKYVILSYSGDRPVYSMDDDAISNHFIYQRILSYGECVNESNAAFWGYVLLHADEKFVTIDTLGHGGLTAHPIIAKTITRKDKNPYPSTIYLKFNSLENKKGTTRLREMGLESRQYACFFSRNNEYHEKYFNDADSHSSYSTSKRNSSIGDFLPACDALKQYGVMCVRVGALDSREIKGDNIVDYTNQFRDEFMDFYLMGNGKFFLGDCSGINFIPWLFNKPMGITNNLTIIWKSWEITNYNSSMIYTIYKKWWDTHRQRYWTLREMMEFQGQYGVTNEDEIEFLNHMGVEFHSNTTEEIRDLAIELNARIDGRWRDDDEMIQLRESFWTIVNRALQYAGDGNHLLYYEPGSCFLKSNSWLLQ